MKENQVRHTDNLRIFSGRFKGTFYLQGRPQPQQERPLSPIEKAIIQHEAQRAIKKDLRKPNK